MDTEVEDHQARTDPRQWAAMEVEGAVGGRLRHEEDGAEEAEEGGEEDEVVVTLDTDPVRTRDPGVGARAGACQDHRTAGHHLEHHHAEGAEEADTAGETHHLEEEVGAAAVGEEAQATTHTTARDQEAGAEITDSTPPAHGHFLAFGRAGPFGKCNPLFTVYHGIEALCHRSTSSPLDT